MVSPLVKRLQLLITMGKNVSDKNTKIKNFPQLEDNDRFGSHLFKSEQELGLVGTKLCGTFVRQDRGLGPSEVFWLLGESTHTKDPSYPSTFNFKN